jgi:hypothetical protein
MSEKEEPMQRTLEGHELAAPKRQQFLRDLKKVARRCN